MGKLALRKPEVPASVVPIFRYDHTQIPNFFFEKFLVNHKHGVAELKVILYLIYLMQKTGDDEIVISNKELATLLDIPPSTVQSGIEYAIEDGILSSRPSDVIIRNGFPINAYKLINPVNFKK